MAHAILFLLLKYTNIMIILGEKVGIYMMEKYINEVILDVCRGNEKE